MVGKTNQLLHGKLDILIYDMREIMQLETLGLFLLKILVVEFIHGNVILSMLS